MIFNSIFILLAIGLTSLYLNKGGVAVFVGLAFLLSFVPIYQNRKDIFTKEKLKSFFTSKPILLLCAFLTTALISCFLGINPEYSVSKWWQIFGVSFAGITIYTGLHYAKPIHFEKFLMYCYWALGFFSLWALIDHLQLIPAFTELMHGENPRLTKYSSVIAIVLPFAIGHALSKQKLTYWIIPTLAVIASVGCGGRSGWVALAVSLVSLYLLYPWETVTRKKLNRNIFKLIAIAMPALGFLVYKSYVGAELFIKRITLGSTNGIGSGRLNIWEFALQNWAESPILGIGIKGFRHLDFTGTKLSSHLHPHNALIEILLETGIVGFTLISAFVLVVMFRLIKTLYSHLSFTNPIFHITAICSLVGFMAYGAASLTLTSIFHAYWLSFAVVLLVLMEISRLNIIKRQEEDFTNAEENKKITSEYPVAVSVVMPCHNSEKYLASAIESVLSQTYQNWELIICNNGSSDKSEQIADEYAAKDGRIVSLKEKKGLGVGLAKNMGVEVARGRYIAFLDSDDKWTEDKLEKQISFMEKSGAPLSGTHYYVIDDNDEITGSFCPSKRHVSYYSLLKANDIGCLTSVYDVHQLGKMYMTSVKVGSDLFLWLDMLKKKPFAAIMHEKLGYYRIHDGANTKSKKRSIKMRWSLAFNQKDVGYLRGFYYFCFYAANGLMKAILGRMGNKLNIFKR